MRVTRQLAARVLGAAALIGSVAAPVKGALPAAYGGVLRLPAPAPLTSLDPAAARTQFEASIAAAICDPLYRVGEDGTVENVLAAGPPLLSGGVAVIRLRTGLRRHGGTVLSAASVAASLRRASHQPRAAWLFGAFAMDGDEPDVRATSPERIELRLVARNVDVGRVLAATTLSIATGRDVRTHPLGTGAFTGRLSPDGAARLRAFAFATEGAPYLAGIDVAPPLARDEALRAFVLGRTDFSWYGESLYGGSPVRPVSSTPLPREAVVLLVPGRAGRLRAPGLWAGVARAVDRRRLERLGLRPSSSLAPGLPAPDLGPGRRPAARMTLRLPVVAGDAFQVALAEALAAQLDAVGYDLRVERMRPGRHARALTAGRFDLRIETVVPALPDTNALVGAALAVTGQMREALTLSRGAALSDPTRGAALAPRLRALVLGRRRSVASHRADLSPLRFDATGRMDLAGLSLPRGAPR